MAAASAETTVPGAEDVKRSAVRGGLYIGVRQVVVQGSNVLGTILLTRLFSTSQFGFFVILVFASKTITLLSGAALSLQAVRSPKPLPTKSLRVLFTAQLTLSVLGSVALWALAPMIARAYDAGDVAVIALRIVSLGVMLSCLQSIPTALLERDLRFGRLAITEISIAITFNTIAVAAAWAGFGIEGVAVGITSQVLVGCIVVNSMKHWPIGLATDMQVLRKEIGSGIAYFGVSVTSIVKDAVNPVFMGLLLGAADVGLATWANLVSGYSVIALQMLQRVYIPTFSRLAADPDHLDEFVKNVLKVTNAVTAPLACMLLVLIHPITVDVFGAKWLKALPAFYLFWVGNLFVPTVSPLLALLQALGRGGTALAAAVMWMLLTWVFGVPAILWLGITGTGLATCLVNLSNYFVIRIAQRYIRFRVLPVIAPVWCLGASVAAGVWFMNQAYPAQSVRLLATYVAAGGVTYLLLFYATNRASAHAFLSMLRSSVKAVERP